MLMDLIKARHSIRKYLDKQISRADLELILEAGNYAPNAGGGQRSMIVGIRDKALTTRLGVMNLAKFDRSRLVGSYVSAEQPSTIDDPTIKNGFYGAPCVAAIFGQNHFSFRVADAFCIAENMVLQATELGISSCIISRGEETFDHPECAALLREWGVPENYSCVCFVIFGYIDGEQPQFKPRKPDRVKIIESEDQSMDAKTCLEKLKLVGVLSFATVDGSGAPQIRCISAIHFDENSFYFFTARGKNFTRELLSDGRVQILAYTRFKEMIRVSAKAVPVSDERQSACIHTIFEEQPYLANVYPGDTRRIGIVFEIKDAEIEYFNLGVNPIFREIYTIGNGKAEYKGYKITEKCIGCGKCQTVCPQQCIRSGKPFEIAAEHCLHCGACFESCPVRAIERLG